MGTYCSKGGDTLTEVQLDPEYIKEQRAPLADNEDDGREGEALESRIAQDGAVQNSLRKSTGFVQDPAVEQDENTLFMNSKSAVVGGQDANQETLDCDDAPLELNEENLVRGNPNLELRPKAKLADGSIYHGQWNGKSKEGYGV